MSDKFSPYEDLENIKHQIDTSFDYFQCYQKFGREQSQEKQREKELLKSQFIQQQL